MQKTIDYTQEDLTGALRAIDSIIHKCEKAQEKFPEGNSHHTLLRSRLKAMYISKALITEKLSPGAAVPDPPVLKEEAWSAGDLLSHLETLHTTDLGARRIRKNLNLNIEDVAGWCRERVVTPDALITRKGKNWYITVDHCVITVNAHSCTIITAHPKG